MRDKNRVQLVWGVLLVMAGIGVFIRIPQVIPKLEQIQQFASGIWFIRFCFYLLGGLLVAGGGKKIAAHIRQPEADRNQPADQSDPE